MISLNICAIAAAIVLQAGNAGSACTAPLTVQPQGTISCESAKELLSQLSDCYGGGKSEQGMFGYGITTCNIQYYQELLQKVCGKTTTGDCNGTKDECNNGSCVTAVPTKAPTKAPQATKTPTVKPTPIPTKAPTAATVTPTAAPKSTPVPTAVPENDATMTRAYQYGLRITELVNEQRIANGLKPVEYSATLSEPAQVRVVEIQKSFAHTRPDGRYFSSVLRDFGIGYRTCGENIAWGQKSPEEVVTAWMNSPGHRANILNAGYTKLGVGYAQNERGVNYYTQLFTN